MAPNERLDPNMTFDEAKEKVEGMTIAELLYELNIEDIRKRATISPQKGGAEYIPA